MSLYLGVDGGGTKTAFALLDSQGKVVAQSIQASSYYLNSSFDNVRFVLAAGIDEICCDAEIVPAEIEFSFFGLPGYGEAQADTLILDSLPGEFLGREKYACGNDMVCGWAGSFGVADGINVIAGTGSMTFGRRRELSARVGGWGELFGDEGSGYWIGRQALGAFTQMSDGRVPKGLLYTYIRETLGVTVDFDVIDVVFNRWSRGRAQIASLSRVVSQASDSGDLVARVILEQAATHLSQLVQATAERLAFEPGATVPVSYSGGVFDSAFVRSCFIDFTLKSCPTVQLRKPLMSPVLGAALYAAKLSGTSVDVATIRSGLLLTESES